MEGIPWEALLLALLPIVGKFLLMVPVVYNKLIPGILFAFNFVLKYWISAGFPTELPAPEPDPAVNLGMLFAFSWKTVGLGLWSLVETYFAHRFYEGKKAEAHANGTVSWWEKGKSDLIAAKFK